MLYYIQTERKKINALNTKHLSMKATYDSETSNFPNLNSQYKDLKAKADQLGLTEPTKKQEL